MEATLPPPTPEMDSQLNFRTIHPRQNKQWKTRTEVLQLRIYRSHIKTSRKGVIEVTSRLEGRAEDCRRAGPLLHG